MSRSTISSILSLFASKVSSVLIAMLFTPILVRLLGPESYGTYATILSIYAISDIIIGSGPNDSIRKYLSEDRSLNWRNSIFGYHFRIVGALSAIIAVSFVGVAWSGVVSQFLGPTFVPLFYLLPGFIFGRQLRQLSRRALMGLMLEKYSEAFKIAYKVIFSISALTLVYFGYGVSGILVADIIVSISIGFFSLIVISRHLNIISILTPSEVQLPKQDIFFFAAGTAAYFACLSSLYHVDVLLLTWWTDSTTVGYYKGALGVSEILWILPLSVQMSMLQSTSKHWQEDNLDVISSLSARVTRGVALLTILGAIGLAVLADSFVPLFLGEDFAPATTPLLYLLPGVVGFAIARPVLSITQASGKIRPLILGTLSAAVLNLLANAVLIPRYGMVGAAVGTSLGYSTLPLSQAITARYIGYSPFDGLRVGRIAFTGLITGVVIFVVDSLISSDLLSLLVVPPIGLACFCVLAIMTRAITAQDRRDIIGKIGAWLPEDHRSTRGY